MAVCVTLAVNIICVFTKGTVSTANAGLALSAINGVSIIILSVLPLRPFLIYQFVLMANRKQRLLFYFQHPEDLIETRLELGDLHIEMVS